MRLLRLVAVSVVLLSGWAAPPLAQAASLDNIADHVLGQVNFTANAPNAGGLSAHSLSLPMGMAFDARGNLYVADIANNRVLEFDDPLTTDHVADRVFGQTDFTHGGSNSGGVSAQSLASPVAVAIDPQGNLYVCDYDNNRVLEYDAPLTSDTVADHVFGQANFSGHTANAGGLNASSLASPGGVALDGAGNLYVAEYGNNRALEYDEPLTKDRVADRVFGQPDFTHNGANNGGLSNHSLSAPTSLALDVAGNIYIADHNNNRVLEYDAPLTNQTADGVFGQGGSFSSGTANNGGVSANSLYYPQELALDARGNLFVVDSGNNRVLEFNTPLSDDTADHLYGQPTFGASTANNGGISASRLNGPDGLALDPLGNLYVADRNNNRVLGFDLPFAHGAPTLTGISPNRVAAGSAAFTLTVNGSVFYGQLGRALERQPPAHHLSQQHPAHRRALGGGRGWRRAVCRDRVHARPRRRQHHADQRGVVHARRARHQRRSGAGPAQLRGQWRQ